MLATHSDPPPLQIAASSAASVLDVGRPIEPSFFSAMMWAPYEKRSERMWRPMRTKVALSKGKAEARRGWQEAEAGGKSDRGNGDICSFSLDRRRGKGET